MARARTSRRRRLLIAALVLAVAAVPACIWAWRQHVEGNFGVVVEGKVYRSAQPSPRELRQWAKQHGLRSVINLRGQSDPTYAAEKATAAELGLELIEARCSASEPPSALWLRRLAVALETAPRPMLIHCAAGADRTGVACVLAAMAVGGQDYATARRQLSLAHGHVAGGRDHIAGLLLAYEEHCRAKGLGTGAWPEFRHWAMNDYHRAYYRLEIAAPAELTAAAGTRVPVKVVIVNRSAAVLPAGDISKTFTLACFSGSSENDSPDREHGRRVELPGRDIAPGESVEVAFELDVPPASTTVHFDVVEEGRTWFARQGSPVADMRLTVAPPVTLPMQSK